MATGIPFGLVNGGVSEVLQVLLRGLCKVLGKIVGGVVDEIPCGPPL
jgi:hypothetical protein